MDAVYCDPTHSMGAASWFLNIPASPHSASGASTVSRLSSLEALFPLPTQEEGREPRHGGVLRSALLLSGPDDPPRRKPGRSVTWSTDVEVWPQPSRSVSWNAQIEVFIVPAREGAPDDCDESTAGNARRMSADRLALSPRGTARPMAATRALKALTAMKPASALRRRAEEE